MKVLVKLGGTLLDSPASRDALAAQIVGSARAAASSSSWSTAAASR